MKLSGAEIVIETLIEQNVKTIFGYPGGTVIDIYDQLYKKSDRITHVLSAHEQGAAHAADGYARATGEIGVVLATSGPGATNLVTGIATAHLDSVPLLAITGNVANNMIGRDCFQEIDIAGVTLPITKHNFIVHDVNELADTIREAIRIAKSGRPGPVLVDIPKDIQQAKCEFAYKAPVVKTAGEPAPEDKIIEAANMIADSSRPYIYFGGGAVRAGAGALISELADKIDAVIGCSMMGLSELPTKLDRFLGMQGMHGHFASSKAMAKADLIIAIGARFSDRSTGDAKKADASAKSQETKSAKAAKKPGRVRSYFQAVKAEMHRVVWPSREELKNYTVAVTVFLIVFGFCIWLVDTGVVALMVGFTGLRG